MLCVCVWHKTQRERNRRDVSERQINEMRVMSVSYCTCTFCLCSLTLLTAVSKPFWCALQHACLWLKTPLWLHFGINRSHNIWSGRSSATLDGGRKLNTCFRNATASLILKSHSCLLFMKPSLLLSLCQILILLFRSYSFWSFFVLWVSKSSG